MSVILDDLLGSEKKKIASVIKDPKGECDLDVWYSPDAITPEIMTEIRGMDEKTAEEDAIRRLLVSFGMEWNLTAYATPVEGEPQATIELPNGLTKWVAAGPDGKPIRKPVPSDFDGMKSVSLTALFALFKAIQDDSRPKAMTKSD